MNEEVKNERRVWWVLGVIVLLVVIFIGIIVLRQSLSGDRPYIYNEFKITPVSNGVVTTYKVEVFINDQGPFQMNVRFAPDQVDMIPMQAEVVEYLHAKKNMTIAIDPYDVRMTGLTTVAALEFDHSIERFFSIPVDSAFTKEKGDYPVMSCADVT